jgi:hypothetical protein
MLLQSLTDVALSIIAVNPLLHFCSAAKASPIRKLLPNPFKSIFQDFTRLPAGKASLAFTPHLISC